MEKIPTGFDIEKIKQILLNVEDVIDVHHIHIWSIDGVNNYATLHIVSNSQNTMLIKRSVKDKLKELGIGHVTFELEDASEECFEKICYIDVTNQAHGNHGHNHHHGHHHHVHHYHGHAHSGCGSDCCSKPATKKIQNLDKWKK